jgi:hypothetical protein
LFNGEQEPNRAQSTAMGMAVVTSRASIIFAVVGIVAFGWVSAVAFELMRELVATNHKHLTGSSLDGWQTSNQTDHILIRGE